MEKDFAALAKWGFEFALKWIVMWFVLCEAAMSRDIGKFQHIFIAGGAVSLAAAYLWSARPDQKPLPSILGFTFKLTLLWAVLGGAGMFVDLLFRIGSFAQILIAAGAVSLAGAYLWRDRPNKKYSKARKGFGRFLTVGGWIILLPMGPLVAISLVFMDAPSATLLGTLASGAAMLSVPAAMMKIGRLLSSPEGVKNPGV